MFGMKPSETVRAICGVKSMAVMRASWLVKPTKNMRASLVMKPKTKMRKGDKMTDRRPDPKPRKHPELWQSYLWWHEYMEMRKRHNLRISSIKKGKSNLSATFEREMMERMDLDGLIKNAKKMMIGYGESVGPIWDWLRCIRGLKAGGETAKLLAQIDDIGKFDTVSKLWRFAGWAVMGGEIDRLKKGQTAPYNRDLKSICWIIGKLFVQHQTPLYVDEYYAEKDRQHREHPHIICTKCNGYGEQRGQKWFCGDCGQANTNHVLMFTPGHLDARARRRMIKIFLCHLWLKWREFEGLPVSGPYVQEVLQHEHIIAPPVFEPVDK